MSPRFAWSRCNWSGLLRGSLMYSPQSTDAAIKLRTGLVNRITQQYRHQLHIPAGAHLSKKYTWYLACCIGIGHSLPQWQRLKPQSRRTTRNQTRLWVPHDLGGGDDHAKGAEGVIQQLRGTAQHHPKSRPTAAGAGQGTTKHC